MADYTASETAALEAAARAYEIAEDLADRTAAKAGYIAASNIWLAVENCEPLDSQLASALEFIGQFPKEPTR